MSGVREGLHGYQPSFDSEQYLQLSLNKLYGRERCAKRYENAYPDFSQYKKVIGLIQSRSSSIGDFKKYISERQEKIKEKGVAPFLFFYAAIYDQDDFMDVLARIFDIDFCVKELKVEGAEGSTALHWAAGSNSIFAMKYLLKDQEIIAKDKDDAGNTPLHWAAATGAVQAAKVLINEFKCDLEVTNKKGAMPVHAAVSGNNIPSIEFFMRNKKVNAEELLHEAVQNDCVEAMDYLLEVCKPDLDSPDKERRIALHSAAEKKLESCLGGTFVPHALVSRPSQSGAFARHSLDARSETAGAEVSSSAERSAGKSASLSVVGAGISVSRGSSF